MNTSLDSFIEQKKQALRSLPQLYKASEGDIVAMEDGRIMQHCSTDPIQTFAEITPSNDHYEQLKALMKYED